MDTERDGDKKSLVESLKTSIAAFVAFIVSIILKPFQLVQGLFTSKADGALAEAKAEVKLKAASTAVAKAPSKIILSSVDIAEWELLQQRLCVMIEL